MKLEYCQKTKAHHLELIANPPNDEAKIHSQLEKNVDHEVSILPTEGEHEVVFLNGGEDRNDCSHLELLLPDDDVQQ